MNWSIWCHEFLGSENLNKVLRFAVDWGRVCCHALVLMLLFLLILFSHRLVGDNELVYLGNTIR